MKARLLFTALIVMTLISNITVAQIVTHSVPRELYYGTHNDDYTVQVRKAGDREWTDLYEYNVKVDMDTKSDASMVYFDFNGTVEIKVQKNNGDINRAVIRPLSKGIVPEINDNALTFTLASPEDLSVEFNGDRLHNLHVFTNPLEANRPEKNGKGVMYFDAGLHVPAEEEKGVFRIPSNTTVYLESGAVLKGKLFCENVENVRICGRGFLLEPQQGIAINFSTNIQVHDIIVINPRHYSISGGQSSGIMIRNFRSFSNQGWSDGIDMMCCSDVLVDHVFMRNSDDCIALYNHRWEFYGGSRNITVRNSTLWADIAHPVNMGGHGDPGNDPGEVMENITIRNIDILEHDEDDPPYQGCIAIDAGDRNLVRNVLCEDIRVESIQEGRLLYMKVRFNEKYDKQPGRGIENVTLRNIAYHGTNESLCVLEGLNKDRIIQDVTFDHIIINGKKVDNLNFFRHNKFIKDIRFK
ncbi:MAG: glycoside hydrolase [Mediterranea sp.]|jgi:hypothetical protein|nr:glycoside hydrolase [Mediterranea sp.]